MVYPTTSQIKGCLWSPLAYFLVNLCQPHSVCPKIPSLQLCPKSKTLSVSIILTLSLSLFVKLLGLVLIYPGLTSSPSLYFARPAHRVSRSFVFAAPSREALWWRQFLMPFEFSVFTHFHLRIQDESTIKWKFSLPSVKPRGLIHNFILSLLETFLKRKVKMLLTGVAKPWRTVIGFWNFFQ